MVSRIMIKILNSKLVIKYNEKWCKVSNIEKAFDTQPVFEEIYLNTKLSCYNNKMRTCFIGKKYSNKILIVHA